MRINGFDFVGELKWREVPFIYVSSKVSGARKTAVKKFVNTDLQLVEDLGANPRSYTIEACVAPLPSDDSKPVNPIDASDINYLTTRDILIEALELEGPGVLVHPLYGTIPDLVVTSYSLNEQVTSVGIGKISIEFKASNSDGKPVAEALTSAEISADNIEVMEKVEESIKKDYFADVKLQGVYAAAKNKVEQIGEFLQDKLSFVGKIEDKIEEISNVIADFQDQAVALVSVPDDLADSITNVFEIINGSIDTGEATFEVLKEFFEFGFITDIELKFNTKGNDKKKTNNRTLNNAMNCNALSNSYLSVSKKNYKTVDEIDADILILEGQMTAILSAPEVDSSLLDSLLDARENILILLTAKKLTVSKIIEIETQLTSSRALSYRYYGDDSEAEDISKLNRNNGLMISGQVQIFSA